jgi:hypothetical protein
MQPQPTDQRSARTRRQSKPSCLCGWLDLRAYTLASLTAFACSDPLEAPPAFESERFLCGEENLEAFETELDDCLQARLRNEAACRGVISFRGVIDEQPVIGDAWIVDADVNPSADPNEPPDIHMRAYAPYFIYSLAFAVRSELGMINEVVDSAVNFVNLEVRGGNYLVALVDGTIDIQLRTDTELRAALAGNLARGGQLETCFHVFPEAPF